MQWSTEQLFKINTTWVTLVCPVQCAVTSWTKWFWSQIRNIACILPVYANGKTQHLSMCTNFCCYQ